MTMTTVNELIERLLSIKDLNSEVRGELSIRNGEFIANIFRDYGNEETNDTNIMEAEQ